MADAEQQKNENIAFIISQIGAEGSKDRRRIDGLIRALIRPVLDNFNFRTLPSHEIDESGSIPDQIIECLLSAKLVVCDLTFNNPNVMYELAIRHAAQLPIVLIAEEGTKIPFDIGDQRTTFFINDPYGIEDFKPILSKKIEAVLEQKQLNNPVSRVIDYSIINRPDSNSDQDNPQQFIATQLSDLRKMMNESLQIVKNTNFGSFSKTPHGIAFDTSLSGPTLEKSYSRYMERTAITLEVFVDGPNDDIDNYFKQIKLLPHFNETEKIIRKTNSAIFRLKLPHQYLEEVLGIINESKIENYTLIISTLHPSMDSP